MHEGRLVTPTLLAAAVALAVLAVWRGLGGMDDITLSDLTIDEDEA